MAFVARDFEINKFGRISFAVGIENVLQKVEKFIVPRLRQYVGDKSNVPLGSVLGAIRILDFTKEQYIATQNNAINREIYDEDDIVIDWDNVTVQQLRPGRVKIDFRVVLPTRAAQITAVFEEA